MNIQSMMSGAPARANPFPAVPTPASAPADQADSARNTNDNALRSGGANNRDGVDLRSGVKTRWNTPEDVAKNFNADRLVGNVAGALESALKMAAAEGASDEELASMRADAEKGIARGFSEAADLIDGLGLMSDELAATLRSAQDTIMERLTGGSDPAVEQVASQWSLNTASREKNDFAFEVRTREGDIMRISASAERQSQYAESRSERVGGGSSSTLQWMSSDRQAYRLDIEGSLSEQERAGLEDLLKQVDGIASRFFGGQYESAFNKAKQLELTDDTLVSMSLNLTRQSVGVAEYQAMNRAGESGSDKATDWLSPIRQYAQALVEAQRSSSSESWGPEALVDGLKAHPKQVSSMLDFAEALTRRLFGGSQQG